jgi:hypothetical protein
MWTWSVEGALIPAGSTPRTIEESGVLEADMAGEVVEWLARRGPFWDALDTDQPFTLTIGRSGD